METGARTMTSEFIDLKGIAEMLSIKPKSVYYIIQSDSNFPKPLVISPRIKRWKKNEVEEWINSKIEQK